eukprot:CAMPEP_0175158694 /NCGR_PEP_ID=MMETSP0087-20121206/22972_1 /TAXON_ID=136419 /ORGANISM="Unknown Unknown, Strain D1" /LENGTH=399 /DNA_ID=CAMNT_0016446587 /DNA_START=55 /DNA_END=1252 /DNA_ORIENTATION=-
MIQAQIASLQEQLAALQPSPASEVGVAATTSSGTPGYFRYPSVRRGLVAFVCEEDLFVVSLDLSQLSGNRTKPLQPKRLTTSGGCTHPVVSPDGSTIAYTCSASGSGEIFLVPSTGGVPRQLTYIGDFDPYVVNWSEDSKTLFVRSDVTSPQDTDELFSLEVQGGEQPTSGMATPATSRCVAHWLCWEEINTVDQHVYNWKHYRGGTQGQLWVDANSSGHFTCVDLTKLSLPQPAASSPLAAFYKANPTQQQQTIYNPASPMLFDGRLYFVAERDGCVGNIYSVRVMSAGQQRGSQQQQQQVGAVFSSLQQHTYHDLWYVRNPSIDPEAGVIAYHCGGQLFAMRVPGTANSQTGSSACQLSVEWFSDQHSAARRDLELTDDIFEAACLHPLGHTLVATV